MMRSTIAVLSVLGCLAAEGGEASFAARPQASRNGGKTAISFKVSAKTIIFLQRALDSRKPNADLAKRVNDYLDERGSMFIRGWHANRRARDRKLFELAAEVAGAAAEKG